MKIKGFRNFSDATIKFNEKTLIIGGNDVGKTNLIYALRILLDKSLSERDVEPENTDFHIGSDGVQADSFKIELYFSNIQQDAVLSILKGAVTDEGECIISVIANRRDLDTKFFVGASLDELEEIPSRFYLKRLNLRYVKSSRDLQKFIQIEKKQLLKHSLSGLDDGDREADLAEMGEISSKLTEVNEKVAGLKYVKDATSVVNEELKKLSHLYNDYNIHLDTGAIKVNQFIDNLELGASSSGTKLMLGGMGVIIKFFLPCGKQKVKESLILSMKLHFIVLRNRKLICTHISNVSLQIT